MVVNFLNINIVIRCFRTPQRQTYQLTKLNEPKIFSRSYYYTYLCSANFKKLTHAYNSNNLYKRKSDAVGVSFDISF